MSTNLTYNEFRSAHKGTPQKEISQLWKEYKSGDYSFPETEASKASQVEAETEPTADVAESTEQKKPVKKAAKKAEASIEDMCKEFDRIRERMDKMPFRYSKEALAAGKDRMTELAKLTAPAGYKCSPTDTWKIWFGPTSLCLLINTTNMMGFRVTRGWWQKHYQTTVYVDRELLQNNDLIKAEVTKLARSNKYIPRTPVVGVECKLPRDVKDIQMRGGQAGDY
jgi:hypothetical protein